MTFRVWTEEKDQRCILTGDGVVTTQRGDYVVVLVVKRWEDVQTAMDAVGKLTKANEP